MKKNNSLLVLFFLLILTGVSVYLYFSKGKLSTVDEDSRNFSFKDTAAITKIFIADKDNHNATIERGKDGWVVNGKHHCRPDAILNLLEVIKLVDVKMPVPKEAKPSVIKYMSFNAVKVEIYVGDEKVRQYYVGHETPDAEGSYMLLTDVESGKNFKDPYVCFIPGFVGFLQPRFIADENDWRDRVVMNYIPPELKQIKVEHFGASPDSSFTIDLKDANTFILKDLNGKTIEFDEAKMRQYLVYFQNVSYEVLLTGKNPKMEDSLAAATPFTMISIAKKDMTVDFFKFYRKKFEGTSSTNEHDIAFEHDPDRMYMSFDRGKQWTLSQYYVFGKLFVNSAYFVPDGTVKK